MKDETILIEACTSAGVYIVEKFTDEVFVCEDFDYFEWMLMGNSYSVRMPNESRVIGCICSKQQAKSIASEYGLRDRPYGEHLEFDSIDALEGTGVKL